MTDVDPMKPTSPGEVQWVQVVRRGARVLFWAAIISAFITDVGAFGLPWIGGTREDLKWIAVVPATGGAAMLAAVFWMTTREPGVTTIRGAYGLVVRILGSLVLVCRVGVAISLHVVDRGSTNYTIILQNILFPVGVLLLFLHLRSLMLRFGLDRMAWEAGMLAWVFPATSLALPLISGVFGFSFGADHPVFYIRLIVHVAVGLLALRLIWRFGTNLAGAAGGRCVHCGYQLIRMAAHRCSECGAPYSQDWPLASP